MEQLTPNGYQNVGSPASGGSPTTIYSLSLSVNPAGAGGVTGGGTYPADSTVPYSTTPNAGYTFSHWSGDISGSVPGAAWC